MPAVNTDEELAGSLLLCYDSTMDKISPVKRLPETIPGRLAAALLALVWIVSMAAVDSNTYSVWPFLVALSVVALLFVSGMLCGGKTIRIPLIGWASLLCGGYFLVRSLCSYAMVESWLESSLIVSCGVFYVAGIYGALSKSGKFSVGVMLLAVLLNILYLYLRPGEIDMLWTGRPEYGLTGHNRLPVNLFVYKNYAGAFHMLGGAVLLGAAMWLPLSGGIRKVCVFVGGISVACSFLCSTRVVYLLAPLLLCVIFVLQFIIELYTRERVRKMTVICGLMVVIVVCVEMGNFLMGHGLSQIADIDTHGRYAMWKPIIHAAMSGPLYGYGVNGSHWEVIKVFIGDQTPNMAHNEYLQTWCDYGVVGVAFLMLIVVVHLWKGFCLLASECVRPVRKGMVALSMLVIISMAVISFSDFYWHSYAFAVLSAYSCGVLVAPTAPTSAPETRTGWRGESGVRTQGAGGRTVLSLLAFGLIGFTCWQFPHLAEAWCAQWKFNSLNRAGADERYEKRLDMLEQVMKSYPDSEIADCYFMLPHYGGIRPQSEMMLRRALAANPKQGYTLTMLVTLLGYQARYEEAELLMRRYYPQEGLESTWRCNWAFFYYYNLLRWGADLMHQGKQELGMSMVQYALNLENLSTMRLSHIRRSAGVPWEKSCTIHPYSEVKAVSDVLKRKLKVLERLGVQKDDSWMQPLEPGGKTALYPQRGLNSSKK